MPQPSPECSVSSDGNVGDDSDTNDNIFNDNGGDNGGVNDNGGHSDDADVSDDGGSEVVVGGEGQTPPTDRDDGDDTRGGKVGIYTQVEGNIFTVIIAL